MLSKLLPRLRFAFVCTISLLATASLAQTTINVGPGKTYTTIQSGIDAAVNGDTVLVAPGTYDEHISFKGKAITVTSSGGAAVTTINGGNIGGMATVLFVNHEQRDSIISNLTITGGGDTIFAGASDGGIYVGGDDAYTNSAAPTIQNNIITANYCANIDVEAAAPAILNNEISGLLQDLQGTQGEDYCTANAAIFLGGTPNFSAYKGSTVAGNTIENNLTGTGIYQFAASNSVITNNIIRKNVSYSVGSAFDEENSFNTTLVQNLIYGNTSDCAGAISFLEPSILIANNTIVDNITVPVSSGSNCIAVAQIYPNNYGESYYTALIINNIISGSTSYPAVDCSLFDGPNLMDQPTFQNNILYNASGPFFGSHCVDVSGEDNNITADPQFVSASTGDYHLKSSSPAIDAGANSVLRTFYTMTGKNFSTDFDGNPRIQATKSTDCIIDMGAYEYAGMHDTCSTTMSLVSSLNPSTFGQNVTFTAQLSSANGVPTGAVQFADGGTVLGSETISGTGASTYSTGQLSVGSHNITATYQPTGVFTAASAPLVQVVNGEATATTLICSPLSIAVFSTALLTATVTSASGTPTGSVAFTDNGIALGTEGLTGDVSKLTYTGQAVGSHTLTATFVPTGGFSSSSASCAETVTALPTVSVLTVSPTSSTFGSPLTLSATVSPVTLPGPSTPTGTVTFYNGTAAIGSGTLASGVASLTVSSLPGGSDNLTCTYGGSSIYAMSNCNSVAAVISAAATTLTLTSSLNPAPALNAITFTATLTTNGKTAGAGNSINLSLNGQSTVLTTDATGAATYTISTLIPGSYSVSAAFAATASLLASSATLIQVVTAVPTGTSLTVTPNPAYFSQVVTMVANVSPQAGTTQVTSGSVTFFDGGTSLGTQPVSASGAATLTISTLAVGTHSITATYSPANTVFVPSSSPVVNEVILASGFAIALSPASLTLVPGGSGTVAIQLTSIGNFAGPLVLTYGSLPTDATAVISPASVTLVAGGAGSSTLTLNTLLKSATVVPAKPGSRTLPVVFAALTLLIVPFSFARRKNVTRLLGFALLAVALQTMVGCTNAWYTASVVASGTYQIPVTATDVNHNSQTATLFVTVSQ
jgi:hypothetical protein